MRTGLVDSYLVRYNNPLFGIEAAVERQVDLLWALQAQMALMVGKILN